MSNAKVRMTIEFDIKEEMLKGSGLTAEEVLKNVYLRDDDVVDGFQITTIIPGFEPTSDFFLENGVIVEESLEKGELSLDEQISVASATKEYELTFFQGKENEKRIRVMLTDEQAETICKNIDGGLHGEQTIKFPDGCVLRVDSVDAIEILDGDCLPARQSNEIERE